VTVGKTWNKLCGRPHYQLNVSKIDRHHFVSSKVYARYVFVAILLVYVMK